MAGDLVIIIWPLWGLMSASQSTSVMGPVFTFKGLFVQCLQYQGGQYQCDNYLKPVFEQPWQLILGEIWKIFWFSWFVFKVRTMGVLSMITACLATGLLLLGLDCCRIWEGKSHWNYHDISGKLKKIPDASYMWCDLAFLPCWYLGLCFLVFQYFMLHL